MRGGSGQSSVRWRLSSEYDDWMGRVTVDFDSHGSALRAFRRAQRRHITATLTAVHLMADGSYGLPTLIARTTWHRKPRLRLRLRALIGRVIA